MKEHVWEVEEIDGGPVGIEEFWICRACGASGGPTITGQTPGKWIFYASGFHADQKLPEDCDAAAKIIAGFKKETVLEAMLNSIEKRRMKPPKKSPRKAEAVPMPTMEDRVRVYEALLHSIQAARVTGEGERLYKLLGRVNNWSYAHRAGNGELSDKELQQQINRAFWALEDK
jgi:hypothetical protein